MNLIMIDETEAERIRMWNCFICIILSNEIFFWFFQVYVTPLLTPHVSESNASDYSDLDVCLFLFF